MSWMRFALRDALLIGATVLLWVQASPISAGNGPMADVFGLLAGLGVGFSAYLLHEWGHLLGGLATGSVVHPGSKITSRYLFSFDSKRNDRRQFLVMSAGGFVVTGLSVWLTQAVLPDDLLATRVARGLISILAIVAIAIEFPIVIWALFRDDLPPVDTFEPSAGPEIGV